MIPPKSVMSAEAAAYPKLLKIYKERNRQNGIIFDAERERNALEAELNNLKGFAKLTRKGGEITAPHFYVFTFQNCVRDLCICLCTCTSVMLQSYMPKYVSNYCHNKSDNRGNISNP